TGAEVGGARARARATAQRAGRAATTTGPGAAAVRATEQVRPNGYAGGRATADQCTERLRLSNILFDSGNELEGYMHDPNTGLWSVITSQPLAGEIVPPTISEI